MKIVKYVHSLNVEERPYLGVDELQSHRVDMPTLAPVPDGALALAEEVEVRVVPIHHLQWNNARQGRGDAYIAYSKEVQDLLEMPFDAMSKQIDTLIDHNDRLRVRVHHFQNMTLWQRIKWVFLK